MVSENFRRLFNEFIEDYRQNPRPSFWKYSDENYETLLRNLEIIGDNLSLFDEQRLIEYLSLTAVSGNNPSFLFRLQRLLANFQYDTLLDPSLHIPATSIPSENKALMAEAQRLKINELEAEILRLQRVIEKLNGVPKMIQEILGNQTREIDAIPMQTRNIAVIPPPPPPPPLPTNETKPLAGLLKKTAVSELPVSNNNNQSSSSPCVDNSIFAAMAKDARKNLRKVSAKNKPYLNPTKKTYPPKIAEEIKERVKAIRESTKEGESDSSEEMSFN